MMTASLESSISDYTAQLSAISAAVEADPGNAQLTQLQAELQQLIDLTQQSLLEQKKAELLAQVRKSQYFKIPQVINFGLKGGSL